MIEGELKNCASNIKPDQIQLELFFNRVCKMIKNESIKISGNGKLVRFDFCMKRLALSYYLQYGKAGYDRLRQSTLEILHSQRTNERTLVHLRGGKGCHVARFAAQFVDVIKIRKNYSNE